MFFILLFLKIIFQELFLKINYENNFSNIIFCFKNKNKKKRQKSIFKNRKQISQFSFKRFTNVSIKKKGQGENKYQVTFMLLTLAYNA